MPWSASFARARFSILHPRLSRVLINDIIPRTPCANLPSSLAALDADRFLSSTAGDIVDKRFIRSPCFVGSGFAVREAFSIAFFLSSSFLCVIVIVVPRTRARESTCEIHQLRTYEVYILYRITSRLISQSIESIQFIPPVLPRLRLRLVRRALALAQTQNLRQAAPSYYYCYFTILSLAQSLFQAIPGLPLFVSSIPLKLAVIALCFDFCILWHELQALLYFPSFCANATAVIRLAPRHFASPSIALFFPAVQ